MNTDLMLRLADQLEARPELYDQETGMLSRDAAESVCPLCVAGNALRLSGKPLLGRSWTGRGGVASTAEALLELTPLESYELFSSTPNAMGLITEFSGVRTIDLDGIDELREWTLSDRLLAPATPGTPGDTVNFNAFWKRSTKAADEWRRSAARVMAATLRLIVAGRIAPRREEAAT